MGMVYKSRHFKRTVLVAAIIGGMWYLYVTKGREGRTKEVRREEGRTLTLQERMQEVLAAREWLAENNVRMGYNAPGGGVDPYSPNRLFNNAPPRTYYGAGPIPDGRQPPAWNVPPYQIEGPFAGGSGDLDKYRRAPSYPDAGEAGEPVALGQQLGNVGQQLGNVGLQPGNVGLQQGNAGQQLGKVGQYGGTMGQLWAGQGPNWSPDASSGIPYGLQEVPANSGYPAWNTKALQNQMLNPPSGNLDSNPTGLQFPNPQNYPSLYNTNVGSKPMPYPNPNPNPDPNPKTDPKTDPSPIENAETDSYTDAQQNAGPSSKAKSDSHKEVKGKAQSETKGKAVSKKEAKSAAPAQLGLSTYGESNKQPPVPSPDEDDPDKPAANGPPEMQTPPAANNDHPPAKEAAAADDAPSPAKAPPPPADNPQPPASSLLQPANKAPVPPNLPPANPPLAANPPRAANPHRAASSDAAKAPVTNTEGKNFVSRFLARFLHTDGSAGKPDNSTNTNATSPAVRKAEPPAPALSVSAPSGLRPGVMGTGGEGGRGVGVSGVGGGSVNLPQQAQRREDVAALAAQRAPPLSFLPASLMSSLQRPLQLSAWQTLAQAPPSSRISGADGGPLQQQQQHQQQQQQQAAGNGNAVSGDANASPSKKGPLPFAEVNLATMVARDKIRWKEDPCPEEGRLQKVTLKTPVGAVAVYMEEGVNTTDTDFNNAFGIQWNMHGVGTLFDRCLLPDQNVSLVDVGAGVGPVAFTAGSLGRQVYAVEPIASRANAMCKTVTDFNYKNVHIIHNAVSDERVKVFFRKGAKGQPADTYVVDGRNKSKIDPNAPSAFTIRLDDILRLHKITSAAIRLDVEGFEGRALVGANKFLNTVNIPCILTEWKHVHSLKEYGGNYVFDVLSSHGFFPHDVRTLRPLKVFRMHDWPADVLWAKLGSYPVRL